jgi:hypothetical protein
VRGPLNLSDWIDNRQKRQAVLLATLIDFSDRTKQSIQEMDLRARDSIRRADLRDHHRSQQPAEEIDLSTIQAKIDARDLEGLTRRERRLVPPNALTFGPARLRVFLEAFPSLWPRVIRQHFDEWTPSSGSRLSAWAGLLASAQGSEGGLTSEVGYGLPALLQSDGPRLVAKAWETCSLSSLLEKLTEHRIRLTSTYAGYVVASWMSGVNGAAQRAAAVEELCHFEREEPWLPRESGRGRAVATDAARIVVVARLLEWWDSLDQSHHEPIEERLLASDPLFGDPRRESLGRAWEEVRKLAPSAFDSFLSTLIQQDLEFFFESVDVDPARKAFWLRYLPSIRRTMCVLEPNTHSTLRRKISAYSADQRASFRRARSFATSDQTETSAFVLHFDRFVVVEFSRTGNAAYVYSRNAFASLVSERGYENVSGLKDRALCESRILHLPGWELRAEVQLSDLRIRPEPSRRASVAGASRSGSMRTRDAAAREPVNLPSSSTGMRGSRPAQAAEQPRQHSKPAPSKPPRLTDRPAIVSIPALKQTSPSPERGGSAMTLDKAITALRTAEQEVIDNRSSGGTVWVVAGENMRPFMKLLADRGISATFRPEGGRTTKNRPSWILKEA